MNPRSTREHPIEGKELSAFSVPTEVESSATERRMSLVVTFVLVMMLVVLF